MAWIGVAGFALVTLIVWAALRERDKPEDAHAFVDADPSHERRRKRPAS